MTKCISEYTKKISVRQLAGTADAHGHIDNTAEANWSQLTASYAKVQSKGGREFWKVDQVTGDVSHVWWCPYSKTLATAGPEMQLVCESVVYEIVSVIDIDLAHQEIEIQTKRAV